MEIISNVKKYFLNTKCVCVCVVKYIRKNFFSARKKCVKNFCRRYRTRKNI